MTLLQICLLMKTATVGDEMRVDGRGSETMDAETPHEMIDVVENGNETMNIVDLPLAADRPSWMIRFLFALPIDALVDPVPPAREVSLWKNSPRSFLWTQISTKYWFR